MRRWRGVLLLLASLSASRFTPICSLLSTVRASDVREEIHGLPIKAPHIDEGRQRNGVHLSFPPVAYQAAAGNITKEGSVRALSESDAPPAATPPPPLSIEITKANSGVSTIEDEATTTKIQSTTTTTTTTTMTTTKPTTTTITTTTTTTTTTTITTTTTTPTTTTTTTTTTFPLALAHNSLPLMQQYNLDKPSRCKHTGQHNLAVAILSKPGNRDLRDAARNSWLLGAVEAHVPYLFFFGMSDSNVVQLSVEEEDLRHHDIVQFNFQDDPLNLTLSNLGIMNWLAENCDNMRYTLVTEDDWLNSAEAFPYVLQWVETSSHIKRRVIYGSIVKNELPERDQRRPVYYVSKEWWIDEVLPSYVSRSFYLLSSDVPRRISDALSFSLPAWHLDQIYVLGYLPTAAGVAFLPWESSGVFKLAQLAPPRNRAAGGVGFKAPSLEDRLTDI